MITSASFWAVLFGSALVFWLLPRGREWFLAAVSIVYVTVLDPVSGAIVVVGSAASYWAARPSIGKRASRTRALAVVIGLVVCLAVFKYLPPLAHAVTHGEHGATAAAVIVPLGLSYFVFKLVAYLVDSLRGVVPAHGPRRFALWASFFPIFSAGPIERFDRFARNEPTTFDARVFGRGLTRILYGLVKKLVLVDLVMGHFRSPSYDFHWWTPPSLEWALAHLDTGSTLSFWQFVANRNLSAYLDFSAYSDIAIGGALLFGYEIGENFDYPIFATNISDYWRRWHMSLSGWCQRYVYMPVVGKTRSPYVAVFVTMFVMGVWHSASLNMIAWGLYHATIIRIYLTWVRLKRRLGWTFDGPAASFVGWALTTLAVFGSASFASTTTVGIVPGFRILLKLVGVSWSGGTGG